MESGLPLFLYKGEMGNITGYLVYVCPVCGKRFEAHIHGDVYERKKLYCVKDGSIMNCTLQGVKRAAHKAKRT
jgi:hypothetical protein